MATRTSVATGSYAAGTTWSGGVAPTSGDAVIVDGGYTVTVLGAAAAAATLLVKNGTLTIASQTVTVDGDCTITSEGVVSKIGTGTLAVGGDLNMRPGGSFIPSVLTVAGRLRIDGRTLGSMAITASGIAQMLGGTLTSVNASGGNRLVCYGSKDLGGNTNVAFYGARGNRAVMMLDRRAYQTGLTP